MRLQSVFFLLFATAIPSCAPGTTVARAERSEDERAVLQAVQQLFDAMAAKDVAAARAVLDPAGSFVSVRWNGDGERVVRRTSHESFLKSLEAATETLLERMWDAEVRVHGPIAVVWTPYDLHIDGEFSHCGIDAFQLLRTEAGWIITGGAYTVERTGCPEPRPTEGR